MAPSDRRQRDAAPIPTEVRPAIGSGVALMEDPSPTSARLAPPPAEDRQPFVREPAPRRTQPPASVTSDDFASENYAESTAYTERSLRPLSGAGYRRSRHQAERLRRDLRYGQYLEVPKGQRDIFATQRRGMGPAVAILIAAAIVIAVIALALVLWPR